MILKDERTGVEHQVGEGGVRLGRDPGLEIPLPESEDVVSGLHCRIVPRDGAWWLEDLGSTNGTWLEGRRLGEPERLEAGQRFSLGQRGPSFRVLIPGQVARTRAEAAESLAGGPLLRLRRIKGGEDLVGSGPEIVIGRASSCTIPLRTVDDTVVSKRHCLIAMDPGGAASVIDLGSRNGTFLNGKPVRRRTPLALGDRIMLGWDGPVLEVRAIGTASLPEGRGAPYQPAHGPAKTIAAMVSVARQRSRDAGGLKTGVFVGSMARQIATESSLAFRVTTLVLLAGLVAAVVVLSRSAAERSARAEAQLATAERAFSAQLQAEQTRSRAEIERLQRELASARAAAVSRAVLDSLEQRLRQAEAAAASAPGNPGPAAETHDFSEVARDNDGAVGLVISQFGTDAPSITGSGFAITPDGYFVTNRHVVRDSVLGNARLVTVVMSGTASPLTADIVSVSTDPEQDVAVLRLRGYHGRAVRAVDWTGTGASQGALAGILGFPFGVQLAQDQGVLRTTFFFGAVAQVGDWIRFSGNTYPGVSGSPVFNAQGVVIAVHFGAPRPGVGLGISVPMSRVRRWLPPQARAELGL